MSSSSLSSSSLSLSPASFREHFDDDSDCDCAETEKKGMRKREKLRKLAEEKIEKSPENPARRKLRKIGEASRGRCSAVTEDDYNREGERKALSEGIRFENRGEAAEGNHLQKRNGHC